LICAARCGPVHPASPLSFCQRCSVSQCARRWCAPHRCRGVTSPVLRKCCSVRWCADMASARLRIVLDQPSPAARPGCRVRGSCGTRPLRQSYITPHCSQCPPVSRKLLLWQPPLRALWVKATGVMQNCLRWSGRTAVGAPRSLRALRAAVCAPLRLSWHLGISQALRALFWSVAYGQSWSVCPRPPLCFAAARHQPCALVCPSAPRGGSLSPRALVVWFCYGFCSWSRKEHGGYRPNGL